MKANALISVVLAALLAGPFFLFAQSEASLHRYNHPQNHDTLFVLAGMAVVTVGLVAVFFWFLTFRRRLFLRLGAVAAVLTVLLFFFSDYQREPPTSLQWKTAAGNMKSHFGQISVNGALALGVVLQGASGAGEEHDDLVIRFPYPVRSATLALFQGGEGEPSVTPEAGEGVAVAFDDLDHPGIELGRIVLDSKQAGPSGWRRITLASPAGLTGVEAHLLNGASPNVGADLALIGAVHPILAIGRFGHVTLQVLMATLFAGLLGSELLGILREPAARAAARELPPWALAAYFVGLDFMLVLWLGLSRYLFGWDSALFPGIASTLAATLRTAGPIAMLNDVIFTFREDYSALPAVPIAFLELPFPEPGLSLYLIGVGTFYAAPAFLAMAWLAWSAAGKRGSFRLACGVTAAALALFPIILYSVCWGYVDIGGVLIVALAAILLLGEEADFAHLLAAGGLLVSLLLFRRWFIFLLPPMILLLVLRHLEGVRRSGGWASARAWLCVTGFLTVLGSFMGLLFVAFYSERLVVMTSGNYANAYAMYWPGLHGELLKDAATLGIAPILLTVAAVAYLIAVKPLRSFGAAALLVVTLALAGFLRVQGFSPQHYLLVVPIFAVCCTVAVLAAGERHPAWRRPIFGAAFICAALAFLSSLHAAGGFRWDRLLLLPQAHSLAPPQRTDLATLTRLSGDLADLAESGKTFCLAMAAPLYNGSVLGLAAEDIPARSRQAYFGGLLSLGDVDRRDPPTDALLHGDIVVVADPVQVESATEEQRIYYVARSLLDGTGLGCSFHQLPAEYPLDGGVVVRLYEKQAPIPEAEWQKYEDAIAHRPGAEMP